MVDLQNYGTPAGFKAYWLARGVDYSAKLDADVSAALIVGSEYIDGNYRMMFPGQKVGFRAQTREWPRVGAYDQDYQVIPSDQIAIEVENATYEAARRQLDAPGSLRSDVTLGTAITRVAISGAVDVTYAGVASAEDMQVRIPAIDAILANVLTSYQASSFISGAGGR